MTDTLSVALLQMEQSQKDPKRNLGTLLSFFDSFPKGTDLAVLPEMWITGFMTSREELDHELIRESFEEGKRAMQELSKRHSSAIYGSLIEPLEDGSLSNTALFFTPDGQQAGYYSKHQLFGPGGERDYFSSGKDRVQITYKGFELRLAVCYDLRFPVWLRQDRTLGLYDALLICANWPHPREKHWQTLLEARSIENQAYVIATNRIGNGPKGLVYPGLSAVLDAWGKEVQRGAKDAPGWLTATLSHEALDVTRSSFPVLDTLDRFSLTPDE